MSFYTPRPAEDDFDEEIDLHGLTVPEAKTLIDYLIRERAGCVRLIVGRGMRSEYIAVLPNAVKNHLRDRGVPFTEPREGVVDVRIL